MKMTNDSVLSGVRQAREDYAKQFGGDVQKMMDDLRRRNAEIGRTTVTREPKLREKPLTPRSK